jgi:hypothetical protein
MTNTVLIIEDSYEDTASLRRCLIHAQVLNPIETVVTAPDAITFLEDRFSTEIPHSQASLMWISNAHDQQRTMPEYKSLKEPFPEARGAGVQLMRDSLKETRRGTFLYANNRLEGNALETIAGMIKAFDSPEPGQLMRVNGFPKVYPVPDGLPLCALVTLVRFHPGYWDLEYQGREFTISMTRLIPEDSQTWSE